MVGTGGIAKGCAYGTLAAIELLLQPFGSGLSQAGTKGMTHQAVTLFSRLLNGLCHDGKESYGLRLVLVEEIGQRTIMARLTLTAQHGKRLTIGQYNVVSSAGCLLEAC